MRRTSKRRLNAVAILLFCLAKCVGRFLLAVFRLFTSSDKLLVKTIGGKKQSACFIHSGGFCGFSCYEYPLRVNFLSNGYFCAYRYQLFDDLMLAHGMEQLLARHLRPQIVIYGRVSGDRLINYVKDCRGDACLCILSGMATLFVDRLTECACALPNWHVWRISIQRN